MNSQENWGNGQKANSGDSRLYLKIFAMHSNPWIKNSSGNSVVTDSLCKIFEAGINNTIHARNWKLRHKNTKKHMSDSKMKRFEKKWLIFY